MIQAGKYCNVKIKFWHEGVRTFLLSKIRRVEMEKQKRAEALEKIRS